MMTSWTRSRSPSLPRIRVTDFLTESGWMNRWAGMNETAWPGVVWLRAEDVARAALDAVRRGQVICTPSARYRTVNVALRLAPRWLLSPCCYQYTKLPLQTKAFMYVEGDTLGIVPFSQDRRFLAVDRKSVV